MRNPVIIMWAELHMYHLMSSEEEEASVVWKETDAEWEDFFSRDRLNLYQLAEANF